MHRCHVKINHLPDSSPSPVTVECRGLSEVYETINECLYFPRKHSEWSDENGTRRGPPIPTSMHVIVSDKLCDTLDQRSFAYINRGNPSIRAGCTRAESN
jgi:hypothetical protein